VEAHLLACRHLPTQDEIRMTRSVFGPDALPPLPPPVPPCAPRHPRGTAGSTPGHGAVGPGHPGTFHPATGPARPDRLLVRALWHVMAGRAARSHLPGWVCPYGRDTRKGAPELAAAQAAGNREAVTGIPGPEVGRPGRSGHNDPSHRPLCPGREWGRRREPLPPPRRHQQQYPPQPVPG